MVRYRFPEGITTITTTNLIINVITTCMIITTLTRITIILIITTIIINNSVILPSIRPTCFPDLTTDNSAEFNFQHFLLKKNSAENS